jgi:hypothetical protein
MCILWTIFCVRVQHVINGKYLTKDIWVIFLNLAFAPISLIMAIKRIPKDFKNNIIHEDGQENLIIAHQRGFCFNCGEDRGPTLVCQSCGWVDPLTTKTKKSK